MGYNKHNHKKWISMGTMNKIQERKNKKITINNSRTSAEKVKAQAEYTEVNKQVENNIRVIKRKFVEQLATIVENASREGNVRQLYDITKKLAGKHSKPDRLVKDKDLLNRSDPLSPPYIEVAHKYCPIDVTPPTTDEIRMVIRRINSWKAVGPGNIPPEALKSDVEEDSGERTNATDGLERKIPHQDSKERRSEQMWELQRNHTTVSNRKRFRQTSETQNSCQATTNSESSIQTSRQFGCTELKLSGLLQPSSSKRYRHL
ncbi:unnamed protein product [Schistosoma curassoni]|uniref:CID domain-containing protein n=1 Tax=Schistosoma curassoni TaxID=6186 RepID=A0A183K6M8_9TREM|nr:unnamed protein product [Schistosoma curassoni]